MKENKKAILEILKKKSKKDGKFESLVLNLALQKIDSDSSSLMVMPFTQPTRSASFTA